MKHLIEYVKEEKEISQRLSFAIGWMKGYKESESERKFTVEEVLELLESIKNN